MPPSAANPRLLRPAAFPRHSRTAREGDKTGLRRVGNRPRIWKPFQSLARRMDRGIARMKRRVLLREPIGVALETLRSHKMRSFLMLLGIILSVSTLIVVVALISGVDRYIADRVANMGSNVFLLTRFPVITDVEEYVKANRRNKKVTWDDFEALRDNLKLPLRVGVELRIDSKVRAGSHSLNDTNIRGVTANMDDIDPIVPGTDRNLPICDG